MRARVVRYKKTGFSYSSGTRNQFLRKKVISTRQSDTVSKRKMKLTLVVLCFTLGAVMAHAPYRYNHVHREERKPTRYDLKAMRDRPHPSLFADMKGEIQDQCTCSCPCPASSEEASPPANRGDQNASSLTT